MIRLTKQFKAIIESDADGYFVASVPALPGCHTQARTMAELAKRLREAIELCLEHAAKNAAYRNLIQRMAYEPSFVGMQTVKV